jgi:hypothetical protein
MLILQICITPSSGYDFGVDAFVLVKGVRMFFPGDVTPGYRFNADVFTWVGRDGGLAEGLI